MCEIEQILVAAQKRSHDGTILNFVFRHAHREDSLNLSTTPRFIGYFFDQQNFFDNSIRLKKYLFVQIPEIPQNILSALWTYFCYL